MSVTAAQSRAVTNGHALAIQPGMTVLFVFLYETEKHRQPLYSKVYGVFGINHCSASVLLGIVFFPSISHKPAASCVHRCVNLISSVGGLQLPPLVGLDNYRNSGGLHTPVIAGLYGQIEKAPAVPGLGSKCGYLTVASGHIPCACRSASALVTGGPIMVNGG